MSGPKISSKGRPALNRFEAKQNYKKAMDMCEGDPHMLKQVTRYLCQHDLFFLLLNVLNRSDMDHDWLFDRCVEVYREPNGCIDLWARDHRKSSIITFGKSIQDILIDPNITIGIFSFTRPIAKSFLRQIKHEFESNAFLKYLFPEILYSNPKTQSQKWSEDDGLIVKRDANKKEATVEAWGLTDGQPTSRHFDIMVYDDVVTDRSVRSEEMIKKTNEAWELSLNLSTAAGIRRYIGTRYHYDDTYALLMDRKVAKPRIYPATDNGKPDGNPVLLTRRELDEKMNAMGPLTAAAQLFLDPKVDSVEAFNIDDLRYWPAENFANMNLAILVDPANKKKKRSDWTVFTVVGVTDDENIYIVNIIRDRLSLVEKGNVLFRLHRQYRPLIVGYEEYGLQADIEYFEDRMQKENYRFRIQPVGGQIAKEDRIQRLTSVAHENRLWIPDTCIHRNYEGIQVDNTKAFVDECRRFPFGKHDDMLDCLSRIFDVDLTAKRPKSSMILTNLQVIADNKYDPLEIRI